MNTIPLVQVHGVDEVSVDQVAKPICGPDDVIVQVAACGICGSDLGYIAVGGLTPPGVPMPLGHELSGTVCEVGDNVSHVSPGQFVSVNPMGNGQSIGNGGNAGGFSPLLKVENVTAAPQALLPIPESLGIEEGALIEPLSVAMHAVNQSGIQPGQSACVLGAGPIGLGAVIALRYLGIEQVAVADMSATRLAIAEELGATVRIKVDEADLSGELIAAHGTEHLYGNALPGTDVFIEATGVGAVLEQTIGLARPGGTVVVVGVHKGPIELDPLTLMMKELRLLGSMAYPDEFPQVAEMLTSGKVNVSPMITHRFPLEDFHTALQVARDTERSGKVIIDISP